MEDEDVIPSSEEGDSDDHGERDYVRGLAQRATDPYFKERRAKGTFVVSSLQRMRAEKRAQARC